jgi:phosphoglycolate phosphatase
MINNIVFDLDGTLLDTIKDIGRALNETLVAYHLPSVTIEEVTNFIGNGTDLLISRALKGKRLPQDVYGRFKQAYLDLQLVYQLERTKPFEDIDTVLKQLVSTGIRLFVFSNKPHDFAQRLINSRFPQLFTQVLGQKPGVAPKPDLSEYQKMASEFNIVADKSLFVGDSIVDIETGRAIGMRVAAVSWGYVPRQKLLEGQPDFIIDEARQLRDIVLAINKALI